MTNNTNLEDEIKLYKIFPRYEQLHLQLYSKVLAIGATHKTITLGMIKRSNEATVSFILSKFRTITGTAQHLLLTLIVHKFMMTNLGQWFISF